MYGVQFMNDVRRKRSIRATGSACRPTAYVAAFDLIGVDWARMLYLHDSISTAALLLRTFVTSKPIDSVLFGSICGSQIAISAIYTTLHCRISIGRHLATPRARLACPYAPME